MSLASVQTTLAAWLDAALDCPITAEVPGTPVAGAGYVWPAEDWVTVPDGSAFCGVTVNLIVDVCASVGHLIRSTRWLADRTAELWAACADGVEVVDGEPVTPTRTGRPFIVRTQDGSELLVARTEFTPFVIEDLEDLATPEES